MKRNFILDYTIFLSVMSAAAVAFTLISYQGTATDPFVYFWVSNCIFYALL